MDLSTWLLQSVLGVVLLSIASNLLSNRIEKTITFLAKTVVGPRLVAPRRLALLQKELQEVRIYSQQHNRLVAYVLVSLLYIMIYFLIATAFVTVFVAFVSASVAVNYNVPRFIDLEIITQALYALANIIAALLYVIGIQRAFRTIRIYNCVENFAEYEPSKQKEIAELSSQIEERAKKTRPIN